MDREDIDYAGRKTSSSTAVGSVKTHKKQLQQYLEDAFSDNVHEKK